MLKRIKTLLLLAAGGFKTMIGGQALIEGIMMLGPDKKSIVVRKPDGELEVKTEPRKTLKEKYPFVGLPLIRGVVNFCSSMYNGVTALMYSAEFYPEDEEEAEPSKFEAWLDKTLGSEKLAGAVITVAMVMGMAFSVFLFILLPTALGGVVMRFFPGCPLWVRNLVEGALKVVIFLSYLILCSKMKDIHRTFQYHGAEHKTIFCYEAGEPLTVENVRKQPKHHPRCGTSFLLVVIIVAILINTVVFALFPVDNVVLRMLVQLLLLPLVVGITYEFNLYVGGHDNPITNFLARPGLWMQNFTTFEPDDSMMEVAIEALKRVIPAEAGKDEW